MNHLRENKECNKLELLFFALFSEYKTEQNQFDDQTTYPEKMKILEHSKLDLKPLNERGRNV